MTSTPADLRPPGPTPVAANHPAPRPGRLWHLGTSAILVVTWPIGLALFIIWATLVSLSLLTVVIPLLTPVAAAIRAYANLHRAWASTVLGEQIVRQPRVDAAAAGSFGGISTVTAPLRDRATWREWLWLLVHASAGFALAFVPVVLCASVAFHLIYPLLYAVTPQDVFGNLFGFIPLRSVADAWLVTPLAGVFLLLWWVTARSLPAANAAIMRSMLGARTRENQV